MATTAILGLATAVISNQAVLQPIGGAVTLPMGPGRPRRCPGPATPGPIGPAVAAAIGGAALLGRRSAWAGHRIRVPS